MLTHTQECTYLGPDYDVRTSRISPAPYCGHATLKGKSYCAEHYPIVYNAGSALRKRSADIRRKTTLEDLCQQIIDIAEELEEEGWRPEQGWEPVSA